MLYQNKNLNINNFNTFTRVGDIEIGVVGHIDREIDITAFDQLQDFMREVDGDFVILARQGTVVTLITHPLLTKTCYYRLNDLEISLLPRQGQKMNWTPCLPNTIYTFHDGILESVQNCIDWNHKELFAGYDHVFEKFESNMYSMPKNDITLTSGKDTGVICAYVNKNKTKSIYHTVRSPSEHQEILKQRIGLIKMGNSESRLVIKPSQPEKDEINKRIQIYNAISDPRSQMQAQDIADLDFIFAGVHDKYLLLGTGGDQLYRYRSLVVTNPTDLSVDILNMISDWHGVMHLNPLMSTRLYQSFLNVQEKYRKTHCWQELYMLELDYPYAVDKYQIS